MARVLVVDDSGLMRTQISVLLEELGHEVVAKANDGLNGYELYKEHHPDIVTMDINMPVLDGLGAVKKIISDFPDARILMISAHEDRALVYEAIGHGAKDFLTKPIELEKLKIKLLRL